MTEHNFDHMRRAMIANQLRTTGTNDASVLAALGDVPRERFVPAERRALAYADALVPLTPGRFQSVADVSASFLASASSAKQRSTSTRPYPRRSMIW